MEILRADITSLKVECIVNASNETGLGCFTPNHPCIDNAIHKKAGPGLFEECKGLNGIPTGEAKITYAHKLPSRYIIHTTGPVRKIQNPSVTKILENTTGEDHIMLAKCYINTLDLAKKFNIREIAFCCISTGIYGFNKSRAGNTAYRTVVNWLRHNEGYRMKVIFVVFTDEDEKIYRELSTYCHELNL